MFNTSFEFMLEEFNSKYGRFQSFYKKGFMLPDVPRKGDEIIFEDGAIEAGADSGWYHSLTVDDVTRAFLGPDDMRIVVGFERSESNDFDEDIKRILALPFGWELSHPIINYGP